VPCWLWHVAPKITNGMLPVYHNGMAVCGVSGFVVVAGIFPCLTGVVA
jgi:hypothetical protein